MTTDGMGTEDFTGRVALVSGASRGIGYAIVAALLVGGAAVTITAGKADELAAAAGELARTVAVGADRVLAVRPYPGCSALPELHSSAVPPTLASAAVEFGNTRAGGNPRTRWDRP